MEPHMSDTSLKPGATAFPETIWMAEKVVQTPISDLKPYANNNRVHTAKSVDKLKASVAKFGFVTPILLDAKSVIIAGHGRYIAAKALGLKSAPTVVADHLSEAEVRALRIADNKLAALSEWDEAALQIELPDLMDLSVDGNLDFDLDIIGFEVPEIDIIIGGASETAEDPPETVEDPDIGKPAVTKPRDLWVLGSHRIFCGNSLEETSYTRVLDGVAPRHGLHRSALQRARSGPCALRQWWRPPRVRHGVR